MCDYNKTNIKKLMKTCRKTEMTSFNSIVRVCLMSWTMYSSKICVNACVVNFNFNSIQTTECYIQYITLWWHIKVKNRLHFGKKSVNNVRVASLRMSSYKVCWRDMICNGQVWVKCSGMTDYGWEPPDMSGSRYTSWIYAL